MRRYLGTALGIAVLALTAACSPTSTGELDPALCKSVLAQGGTATDYGRCMLGQGQGKTVGGMPVLNRSAQLFLRKKGDDGCLAPGQTSTDYLACEFALDPGPASAPGADRLGTRTDLDALPLTIIDRN